MYQRDIEQINFEINISREATKAKAGLLGLSEQQINQHNWIGRQRNLLFGNEIGEEPSIKYLEGGPKSKEPREVFENIKGLVPYKIQNILRNHVIAQKSRISKELIYEERLDDNRLNKLTIPVLSSFKKGASIGAFNSHQLGDAASNIGAFLDDKDVMSLSKVNKDAKAKLL
ncbi:MAG: hypothetical protein COV35_01630 [Alphaproteobacteria bacterium CG11_big_fil_rev_8_21_14_0_20_39_49]|nr:MAG: hypothetical protein COV35_01630 [Alphaproteobacteria bacterium CG11_big_fil_rev_8_21_14_0_20_39_49]